MSKLRAFDSLRFDRIDAPFGAPGVTSWNGQTGDVIGTLANIYGFGLGTSPTVDNRFTGPGFSWTFPLVDVGGNSFGTGAFEANVNSDITYWNYVRRAGNHTINTARTFNLWSINDPTWNGSGDTLSPVQTWVTDDVRYGADTGEPIVSQAQLGQGTYEWRDGGSLFFDATNASSSFSQEGGTARRLARRHYLWNQAVGVPEFTDSVDGYGNAITTSVVGINGLIPVDIRQVRYTLGALNRDDGFGYFLATGFLEDLNGTEAKGWYSVRSVAGGSSDTAWYSSLAASSGALPGHMVEWLRGYTDVGAKVMVGGLQLPSVDTTTFAVSDAATARLAWDQTLRNVYASTDGQGYRSLVQLFETAEIDFTATSAGTVMVPAQPGAYFVSGNAGAIWVRLTAVAGARTTNPTITIRCGAQTLFAAAFPVAADFTKGAGAQDAQEMSIPIVCPVNTAVTVDVTVAATGTGGFVWKGKISVIGTFGS